MSLTVEYFDVPVRAQEKMAVQGVGQPFSNLNCVVTGGITSPFATLEPGIWKLDGSRELLPDVPEEIAWWSAVASGENGVFEEPPELVLHFSEVISTTGMTFTFSPETEQWPTEISASFYNGQTLLAQGTVMPNEANYVWQFAIDSFDRVVLRFLATQLPGQFVKLQKLRIGQVILFGKDELTRVNLINEADPSLGSLTADTMTVEIHERKGRELRPQNRQKMILYRDGVILASQYIQESKRQAQHYYTFSCQSVIGLLEDDFLGGLYHNVPVEDVLTEVLADYGFVISDTLSGSRISGYLPVCTKRAALQQIAFAIGAVVTTQGDGVIRLDKLQNRISGMIAPEDIFEGAEVETRQRTAKYEVFSHSYTAGNELMTLLDGEAVSGENILFLFREPHHSYAITGGHIIESGENWVRLSAEGMVTLTGKNYIHSMVRHTRYDPTATGQEQNNVLSVENATLVSTENVTGILERLYECGQLRQTLTQEVVVRDKQVGQRIASVNPWGTQTRGILSAMDSVLTQSGHTAQITVQGVEVRAEAVFHYSGQIYAGNGEVLV